jgi:hypothetical protein
MGLSGVQRVPKAGQSCGFLIPRMISPLMQSPGSTAAAWRGRIFLARVVRYRAAWGGARFRAERSFRRVCVARPIARTARVYGLRFHDRTDDDHPVARRRRRVAVVGGERPSALFNADAVILGMNTLGPAIHHGRAIGESLKIVPGIRVVRRGHWTKTPVCRRLIRPDGILLEPPKLEGLCEFGELLRGRRFYDVGIGAVLVGAVEIDRLVGRS